MPQHVRGAPVIRTGHGSTLTGVHPACRRYFEQYLATHQGTAPGRSTMAKVLAGAGVAPDQVGVCSGYV